jgi:hypothetical protein
VKRSGLCLHHIQLYWVNRGGHIYCGRKAKDLMIPSSCGNENVDIKFRAQEAFLE